jgi:hypothetical protein
MATIVARPAKHPNWWLYLAVGLIALPFVLDQNAWYEWSNALWLLELQAAHVGAYGLPTYFIDAPAQYFYPNFVFYGGTTFSVLAYPAVVFGSWPVFAATTALSFIAIAAGIGWTARNLGVPSRLAVVPGILFALTPYTVSNLYGRGAWTELVAVAGLSVALGAATSLTSDRARNRPWTILVLALAVATIAGTHNITLLFSALIVPLLLVALLPLAGGSRGELVHRHLLVLAGAVIGVAACGAFLVPDVWLSDSTLTSAIAHTFLVQLRGFDGLGVLFSPLLVQPRVTMPTDLHTQTLLLPLVWVVVVAAVALLRRRLPRRTTIALAVLCFAIIAIAVLIANPSWWLSFPAALQAIQFPFRLVTYLALFTVLGVIALLATPALRSSRLATVALLVICAWQVSLAVVLATTAKARGGEPHPAPTPTSVTAASVPTAFAQGLLQAKQFRLIGGDLPAVPTRAQVQPIGDDTPPEVTLSGDGSPGSLVATSVVDTPLIHVSGQARVAGSTSEGFVVLRVTGTDRGEWRARIAPACSSCLRAITGQAPAALLIGKLASLLGVLALVGLAVAGARTRTAGSSAPAPRALSPGSPAAG